MAKYQVYFLPLQHNWVEKGIYSSNGKPAFNIGKTTFNALSNYHNHNIEPLECGTKSYEENDNES